MGKRPLARFATIRSRTTAAACLVVAVALVVTAFVFIIVMRRTLTENVQDTARARAEELAVLLRKTTLPVVLPDSGEKGAVIQVIDADGRVVAGSAQITSGARLSELRPPPGETQSQTLKVLPIEGDQSGDQFRVFALGAQGRNGALTVYVGISLDPVDDNIMAVRRILFVVFPVLLVIVSGTGWYFVGRALRPVDVIRQQVADIGGSDLSRRVPEPPLDDEIGRLARGMNLMLSRLQSSNERQRRFVADASHELQSPLASSLSDLEEALAHPDSTEWSEIAAGLIVDNQRMAKLVGDLLFLARHDDGALLASRGPVDLDDIAIAEVIRLRAPSPVVVDTFGVTPVEVRANREQLERVVRNLLANAVCHAESRVDVRLTSNGTEAILVISDDGPGIPVDAHERIFERFTRLDDSRSRHTGGSGLGLSIAREIVESHNGTILAEPAAKGAQFVVRLPVTPG